MKYLVRMSLILAACAASVQPEELDRSCVADEDYKWCNCMLINVNETCEEDPNTYCDVYGLPACVDGVCRSSENKIITMNSCPDCNLVKTGVECSNFSGICDNVYECDY